MELARQVVEQADQEHPADDVMRLVLRGEPGLDRDSSAAVARLVFGYYRWLAWMEPGWTPSRQLEEALDLTTRFAREPDTFQEALLKRVVPEWIHQAMDVTPAWLRSLQTEPRLWLRARPGAAASVAAELLECKEAWPERLPDALWFQGTQDLFRTRPFHDGRFELQDLSSQMVGALCAPKPGESWWDVCAGEGGKTLHLADQMANRGVVWATDRAEWRLDRLRIRARRAELFNIRWARWEGGMKTPGGVRFDGVLVDAPCSGVGTWQRNPHARWTLTAVDVAELAALQGRILAAASTAVKPGGRLIYAVCTLTRAETVEVARAFEANCPGFEPLPIDAAWRGTGEVSEAHHLWIRPEDRGGNGMFLATWRRK